MYCWTKSVHVQYVCTVAWFILTSRITNSGIPEIPIAVNEVFFITLNLESGVQ